MSARPLAFTLSTPPAAVPLPGTWKLQRGQAITLRPTQDGILRVARGRLWATVEGPHGGTPADAGDHFLEVGRAMYVRAGRRVVIEAWTRDGATHFAWDPVAVPARAVAARRLNLAPVRQPLADLRIAVTLVLRALAQLGRGVLRLGWELAHGRRGWPGSHCPHGAC